MSSTRFFRLVQRASTLRRVRPTRAIGTKSRLFTPRYSMPGTPRSRGFSLAIAAMGVGTVLSSLQLNSSNATTVKCDSFDVGDETDHFHLLSTVARLSAIVDSKILLKALQKQFKAHGDRALSMDEVSALFELAGVTDKSISENIFKVMDFNNSGTMEAHEVAATLTLFQKGSETDRYKFLFRCLDLDGSGKVDKDEFRQTLMALLEARYHLCGLEDPFDPGDWYVGLTNDDYHTVAKLKANQLVRTIFLFADQNRDGDLSMKEFLHWCKRGGREVRVVKDLLEQTLSHETARV